MNFFIRILIAAILLALILITVQSHSEDARYEVLLDDHETLQEAYDDLHEGYNELQQEHSKAVEKIEYLEYKLERDEDE